MPTDVSPFIAGLDAHKSRVLAAVRKAVDHYGEKVLGDAQDLAPVDTGALKASATGLPAEIDGDEVSKVIGFNTNYAVFVHENLTAHHPQGQAKYLETAIRQCAPEFAGAVADAVKAEVSG